MNRRLISSGTETERTAGYSRAVVDGDWVFVAGVTGYDPQTHALPAGVTAQALNAFRNIELALAQADATLADVVRANYIVSDRTYIADLVAVTGRLFAEIRPASTLIVAGLYREEMKIEIEVTAVRRR